MSLSGSIEDLPLLEILQVVAYCGKTGYLTVRAPAGEAAVVFRDGRVVSGYIWDVPPLDPSVEPGPAREGRALFSAFRAAVQAIRDLRRDGRMRQGRGDDEDALFI